MNEEWYYDSDGAYMPASVEAWDELFDETESFYRQVIPGFETMNDNMRNVLIQYVGNREHGDDI